MIQDIIDSCISEKLKALSDVRMVKERMANLPNIKYAFDFSTIAINLGRGAGHSKYILDNAKSCDIIITINRHTKDYVFGGYSNVVSAGSDFNNYLIGKRDYFRYVWFDSASTLPIDRIVSMYDSILLRTPLNTYVEL